MVDSPPLKGIDFKGIPVFFLKAIQKVSHANPKIEICGIGGAKKLFFFKNISKNPKERFEKLLELMQTEIEILQVEKKIRTRVKKQMEKTQKEYYLNEQMQAIQKELGERDEIKNELQELHWNFSGADAAIPISRMSCCRNEKVFVLVAGIRRPLWLQRRGRQFLSNNFLETFF